MGVRNVITGGELGKSCGNSSLAEKNPPSYKVSWGPMIINSHTNMLSSSPRPTETPSGGFFANSVYKSFDIPYVMHSVIRHQSRIVPGAEAYLEVDDVRVRCQNSFLFCQEWNGMNDKITGLMSDECDECEGTINKKKALACFKFCFSFFSSLCCLSPSSFFEAGLFRLAPFQWRNCGFALLLGRKSDVNCLSLCFLRSKRLNIHT